MAVRGAAQRLLFRGADRILAQTPVPF